MRKVLIATFVFVSFILASCASTNQLAQQNSDSKLTNDGYKLLEQKLIEDYLANLYVDQLELMEEEEVMVYNLRNELEYQGKAINSDAKILIINGEKLIDIYNKHIYQINR
jgi:hypothetical protein